MNPSKVFADCWQELYGSPLEDKQDGQIYLLLRELYNP